MDFACPKCKSTNVKKLSLVHEEGITTIHSSTQTRATGVGLTPSGIVIGVGAATGTTSGIQQTELSKRATPPPETKAAIPKAPSSSPVKPGTNRQIFGFLLLFSSPFLYWLNVVPTFWGTVLVAIILIAWGNRREKNLTEEELKSYKAGVRKYKKQESKWLEEKWKLEEQHEQKDPHQIWKRSFTCLTCGNTFDPPK